MMRRRSPRLCRGVALSVLHLTFPADCDHALKHPHRYCQAIEPPLSAHPEHDSTIPRASHAPIPAGRGARRERLDPEVSRRKQCNRAEDHQQAQATATYHEKIGFVPKFSPDILKGGILAEPCYPKWKQQAMHQDTGHERRWRRLPLCYGNVGSRLPSGNEA